ncbi:MAG: siroheme decarboxylase subunit beta [Gammaproteobacteria bacterium]
MIDDRDKQLLQALQDGLPLCSRPYAALGERIGMAETEVLERLARMKRLGPIKRFGVVVNHQPLGYRANAMVVWNVPDAEVDSTGLEISRFEFVTLCYRRPRRLPDWPYNLFCMIHGKDRDTVLRQLASMRERSGLGRYPHAVLFSRRCFKQRGAQYFSSASVSNANVPAYG